MASTLAKLAATRSSATIGGALGLLMVFTNALCCHGYDYETIVPEYCHVQKDWGAIPDRPEEASELLQVQVFIRHGSRTQCSASPACWHGENDQGSFNCSLSYLESSVSASSEPLSPYFKTVYLPDRNALPGNCLAGQLVEDGFAMERSNGVRLRDAYVLREGFLPESLVNADPAEVRQQFFLRSTDVPRTKQSGMALFAGMYKDVNTGSLPFIPLHTMDFKEENMVPANAKGAFCPSAKAVEDEYFETHSEKRAIVELCKELLPDGSGLATSTAMCFWALQHLIDCLMSRICPTVPFFPKNSTVPGRYLENNAMLLRRVWKLVDEVQYGFFQALARRGTGPFLAEVLSAAHAAAERHGSKFHLYSGHDTGPMEPLWAALQLRPSPPYWPPFASMLVLELWKSASGPLVRWISNGAVVGGGVKPLADFDQQVKALIPSKEECTRSPASLELWAVQPSGAVDAAGGFTWHWVAAGVAVFAAGIFTALLAAPGGKQVHRWWGYKELPNKSDDERSS